MNTRPSRPGLSSFRLLFAVVLLLGLLGAPVPALADTAQPGPNFTVNNTGSGKDGVCGTTDCTIRDAIAAANANADASTVTLQPNATYSLTVVDNPVQNGCPPSCEPDDANALPRISTPVTIVGNNATIARASGAPAFRLFQVNAGASLTLSNVILKNNGGASDVTDGGFILNRGTLSVDRCTMLAGRSMVGGAISNYTVATVSNSTIDGGAVTYDGGAIFNEYNTGTLTVANSTIMNCDASHGFGGAIVNEAHLTIVNSTLVNNTAGQGGAIFNRHEATILNTTFAGNYATYTYTGSTFDFSLEIGQTMTIKNSILLKKPGGKPNCEAAVTGTSVANIADNYGSDSSCGATGFTYKTPAEIGLQLDVSGLPVPAANGGPTKTVKLSSAGYAVDRGDSATCQDSRINNRDQRGYNRFFDGPDADTIAQCDVGAYEYGATAPPPGEDMNAPITFIHVTPAQPDGAHGWYKSPVTVAPEAVDDSEILELRCALDPAQAPVGFDDLPAEPCPFLGGAAVEADGEHAFYAAAMDVNGNKSDVVKAAFKIDATAPVITCPAGGPFLLGSGDQPVGPAGVDASVSGLDEAAANVLTAMVPTNAAGLQTVTFSATDLAGSQASKACTYQVIFNFGGFYPPVEPAPALNEAKAGSAIPVKFSLGGDAGLDVIAAGYPVSQQVDCQTRAPAGTAAPTVSPGESGLSYDPATGWYGYGWKTEKGWAGTCRAFTLKLADGTQHFAYFQFK